MLIVDKQKNKHVNQYNIVFFCYVFRLVETTTKQTSATLKLHLKKNEMFVN